MTRTGKHNAKKPCDKQLDASGQRKHNAKKHAGDQHMDQHSGVQTRSMRSRNAKQSCVQPSGVQPSGDVQLGGVTGLCDRPGVPPVPTTDAPAPAAAAADGDGRPPCPSSWRRTKLTARITSTCFRRIALAARSQ